MKLRKAGRLKIKLVGQSLEIELLLHLLLSLKLMYAVHLGPLLFAQRQFKIVFAVDYSTKKKK